MIYAKVKNRNENGASNKVIELADLPYVIADIEEAAKNNEVESVWFIGFVQMEPEDFEKHNKNA